MNRKNIVLPVLSFLFFPAFAATVDLASALVDGAVTLNQISSGDSYTYSGEGTADLIVDLAADAEYSGNISGNIRLVKRGAGVLKITSENTYTGGSKVEGGILAFTSPSSLGGGDVEVVASSKNGEFSCLRIDKAMTFANNIVVTGGMSGSGSYSVTVPVYEPRAAININTETATVLSGNITSYCDLYIWDAKTTKTRTFTGNVTADGHHIFVAPFNSTIVFSGGVKAKKFYASYLYMHMGIVRFEGKTVDVDEFNLAYTKAELYDVFGANAVFHQNGSKESVRTIAFLKEDVTVGGWKTERNDNPNVLYYSIQCSPENTARKFTIRASESATSYGTLRHKVSLVYDPVSSSCVQTLTSLSQRTHDTTGEIVVKGGTFKVTGYVSLPGLAAIRVADGASFVADTKGVTPFKGLDEIEVGKDATFFCAGDTATPFSFAETKLAIQEGSSVSLPENETFTVSELWRNGVRLPMGHYTPDGANGTKVLPELKSGTISVPYVEGETVVSRWTGSESEQISSASNWSGGVMPDLDNYSSEMVFAEEGSTSTRAVFSNPCNIYSIVFRQPLGFTLASAGMGKISLMEGVSFGDIGDAAPRYTIDVPIEISTDQTWVLPSREDSVFTISKPLLSHPDETGIKNLYITNDTGTLNFHMTNSTFCGNINAQAKTMNISGEGVFGPSGKGGSVTLKLNHHNNTAKCNFTGCTIDKPLICTMAVSGTNYEIFNCAEGTTNVFNGYVTLPDWSAFRKNTLTVFNGGATLNNYTRTTVWSGATLIFRNKLRLSGTSGARCFDPRYAGSANDVPARYVFDCPIEIDYPDNYQVMARNCTIFDFRREYAMKNGFYYSGDNSKTLLNGFSQRAWSFCDRNKTSGKGIFSSTNLPAFFELDNAVGAAETNAVRFADLAGFKMIGAGFVRLNGISTTSGTLAVENGIVEMGDATWLNASNVVVSGTGRLKVTKDGAFDPKKAALALSGSGVVEVGEGVTAKFLSATVDDGETVRNIPMGTYNAASSGLMAGRIAGNGNVCVVGHAFLLIVK